MIVVVDLKQTNFIERLVEDTLAAETAPDGQALTFQHQAQQPHFQEEEFKGDTSEYQEDSMSQFSRMNESIDQTATSSQQDTQATESVDLLQKKKQ